MTDQHPITPPPEVMRHWARFQGDTDPEALWFRIATEAAQWGADQELEACRDWLFLNGYGEAATISKLIAARRPKPPSLKEEALKRLESLEKLAEAMGHDFDDTIRRALETLPND